MRAALLYLFFLPSLPVAFVRPFYGVLLWMIVAFLNPQSFVWAGSTFPFAFAIGIATIAGLLVFERNWVPRLASREAFLVIVLLIWFTVTSVISAGSPEFAHHAADTWYKWSVVSKILLMTLVTIAIVHTAGQLRALMLVIAGCFAFFVIKAFPFMILTGGKDRLYGPADSMIADNNDFGLALVVTLPIFFYLAQAESSRWLKWGLGFTCLITVPAIFFTYSRGALLGLIIVVLLIVLLSHRRLLLIPVIVTGSIVALMFAPEAWLQRMNLASDKIVDASAQERLHSWAFCWRLATDHPITGGGFATFTPQLFSRYTPEAPDVFNSHSIYFGVLAEQGFTGLLLYLLLIGLCLLTAQGIIRQARAYGDEIAVLYARMLSFSIIGFAVSGAFLSRAYFDYYFALVAAIAILKRVCESQWNSIEETVPHDEKTPDGAEVHA